MSVIEIIEFVIMCIMALFVLLFIIMLFLVGVSFIIDKIDDIRSEIKWRKQEREEEKMRAMEKITQENGRVFYLCGKDGAAVKVDITELFGDIVAEHIYSVENASPGIGIAMFKRYCAIARLTPDGWDTLQGERQ